MEKDILREIIEKYKGFRELWDPSDPLYSNKVVRDKAYEVLLELYKRIDAEATIRDIKNKIENLRTTYRRERRRVLQSEMRDDEDSRHVPHLWYYKHMTFLNDVYQQNRSRCCSINKCQVDDTSTRTSDTATQNSKRRKLSSPFPTVFVTSKTEADEGDENSEEDNTMYSDVNYDQDDIEETPYFVNECSPSNKETKESSQLKAFANSIGMQLKDAAPQQRFIAEKLISDVVFLARMNKLSINSVVLAKPPQ